MQLIHTLSRKLVNGVTGIVQALTAEKVVVEFFSLNITREIPKISFTGNHCLLFFLTIICHFAIIVTCLYCMNPYESLYFHTDHKNEIMTWIYTMSHY